MTDHEAKLELRLEVEVPGTPEQVWQAIATGPGITAWFVPTTLDEREGGTIDQDFGEGLGHVPGVVTAYDPPTRIRYEGDAGGRTAGFEFLVEAREGGSCVVRFVQTGFDDSPESQAEFRSLDEGWRLFFEHLRMYLEHFAGQRCTSMQVHGHSARSAEDTWELLKGPLGITSAVSDGSTVTLGAAGGPSMTGRVQRTGPRMVSMLVTEPFDGTAFCTAEGFGEATFVSLYAYAFSERAEVVDRDRARWTEWLTATLAPADAATR